MSVEDVDGSAGGAQPLVRKKAAAAKTRTSGAGVVRFIDAELAAAGKHDRRRAAPVLGGDRIGCDAFAAELGDRRVEVVADQIELVEVVRTTMDAELGGGQLED